MGTKQSTPNEKLFGELINMGFEEYLAEEAIDNKCKDSSECVEYIVSKKLAIPRLKFNKSQTDNADDEKNISNIMEITSVSHKSPHIKNNDMVRVKRVTKFNRFVTYINTSDVYYQEDEENDDEVDDNNNDNDNDNDNYNDTDSDYVNYHLYEFGASFNYWNPNAHDYVARKHKNLHEEMLNNKYGGGTFRLDENEWKAFVQNAKEKDQEMYGNKDNKQYAIYAKNRPLLNNEFGIKAGSKLSIDHILSILLYTDTEELQTCLKKQCRKISQIQCICVRQLDEIKLIDAYNEDGVRCYDCNSNIDDKDEFIYHCADEQNAEHKDGYDLCIKCADKQMISEIAERNGEYHNWLKLLSEVVYLFGDELPSKKSVYHGISVKLLFNGFDVHFRTPLSTTTDLPVATRFAFGSGIILELVNGGSRRQPYIHVDFFSQFAEREYLFFGCHFRIKSIRIADGTDTHFNKEIRFLTVYMNILNGSILNRYDLKDDIKECKDDLIIFIKNHMSLLQTGIGNEDDAGMDKYILQLFLNCTAPNKRIWINLNQIRYLQNIVDSNLSQKFILFDDDVNDLNHKLGEYLSLLQTSRHLKLNISVAGQYKWLIQQNDLKQLLKGKTGQQGLFSINHWMLYIDNDMDKLCAFRGNMILKDGKIGFCMVIVALPETYQSVHVSYQLYCKQINFNYMFPQNIMTTTGDSKYGFGNVGNASLFNASKLDELETFEWEIVIKCY